MEETLAKLNRIWIGTYIIRAFIPRFKSGETVESSKSGGKIKVLQKGSRRSETRVDKPSKRLEGISYSEVLKEVRQIDRKQRKEWEEHGEELQNECGGNLLSHIGSNMILIKGKSEMETENVIRDYDEWAAFWLDWSRPWKYTDLNQHRRIWTRWIGVPLQAWSLRFFSIACTRFGNFSQMHEVTKKKTRLDEAFIIIQLDSNQLTELFDTESMALGFKSGLRRSDVWKDNST